MEENRIKIWIHKIKDTAVVLLHFLAVCSPLSLSLIHIYIAASLFESGKLQLIHIGDLRCVVAGWWWYFRTGIYLSLIHILPTILPQAKFVSLIFPVLHIQIRAKAHLRQPATFS